MTTDERIERLTTAVETLARLYEIQASAQWVPCKDAPDANWSYVLNRMTGEKHWLSYSGAYELAHRLNAPRQAYQHATVEQLERPIGAATFAIRYQWGPNTLDFVSVFTGGGDAEIIAELLNSRPLAITTSV